MDRSVRLYLSAQFTQTLQPVVLSAPDPLSYILDDAQELEVHTDRFLALCEQLSQEVLLPYITVVVLITSHVG
jgi:hypothetical protein